MNKIKLICLGSLKERHWREAVAEYVKRLQAYVRLEIIEMPAKAESSKMNEKLILMYKEEEAKRISKYLLEGQYIVALDVLGRRWSTEKWAQEWLGWHQQYEGITFIIGGSYGLSESILKRVHLRLSLSDLTFPHQMCRLIFVEQLYRVQRIAHGHQYHK